MTAKENKTDRLQDLLQDVFRFNQADLRANRRGVISDAQKQRLQAKHEDDAQLTYGGLVAIAVIGYLGSGAAALQSGVALGEMWRGVTVSLLVLVLFAWILLHISGAKMRRTLHTGTVEQTSGPLQLIVESAKPRSHYFCVGSRRFEITAHEYFRLHSVLDEGRQATVYYSLPWRRVLSVALA